MTNNEIWQIVLAVLTSVGGTSGIIILGIKFSSDIIAKKLEEKYKLKLNKELESYKADMQRKIYVSKVRFDKEFEIYQKLMEKVLAMTESNHMLFPVMDRLPADFDKRRTLFYERYEKAIDTYNAAVKDIHANSAFIIEKFYDLFTEVAKLCRNQIIDYEEFVISKDYKLNRHARNFEYADKSKIATEITNKSKFIISELRKYLQSLDVR